MKIEQEMTYNIKKDTSSDAGNFALWEDYNQGTIKDGGIGISTIHKIIPMVHLYTDEPYIVQDKDVAIITSNTIDIFLPAVIPPFGRQLFFKHQDKHKIGLTLYAAPLDTIDGLKSLELKGGEYLHLISSTCPVLIDKGRWNILTCSEQSSTPGVTSVGLTNSDNNLTITGSPITTSGDIQVNLNADITANHISVSGIGIFNYLETKSLISNGQVIADDFITAGGLIADGTLSGGTLVSKGDITSASDITAMRLNLAVNNTTTLRLEANIAQNNDVTLIFPATAGTVNQVLSTDGVGNLAWVDSNIVINNSTTGKSILNGTTGVVINTLAVTEKSIISITRNVGSGLPQIVTKTGNLIVGSIMNKISFTVFSTTENDTDNFDWFILNP